jgi:hypothetical protein
MFDQKSMLNTLKGMIMPRRKGQKSGSARVHKYGTKGRPKSTKLSRIKSFKPEKLEPHPVQLKKPRQEDLHIMSDKEPTNGKKPETETPPKPKTYTEAELMVEIKSLNKRVDSLLETVKGPAQETPSSPVEILGPEPEPEEHEGPVVSTLAAESVSLDLTKERELDKN